MAFGDFTVTRASTKNVLGSAGLYVSVANDTPALEFNADGSYLGTLVELGATNLLTYSQDFNNAAWTKTATITSNSDVAPDGTTTADSFEDASASFLDFRQSVTIVTATTYTVSVFIKKTVGALTHYPGIGVSLGGGTELGYAIFNTTTGATNTADVVGLTVSTRSTEYPDYWRFEFTFLGTQTSGLFLFYPALSSNGTTISDTAQGSNVFWQAQLETGSVATSYIVTTGSTASRVADVVSLTGASSLIGQTEGTLYVEAIPRGITSAQVRPLVEIDNGDIGNDGTVIRIVEAGNFQLVSRVSAATVSITSAGLNTNVLFKFAGAYKTDDFIAYVNGSSIGSVVSGGVFGGNTIIRIGGDTDNNAFNGWIRSVAIFPTRLANATLASITTL